MIGDVSELNFLHIVIDDDNDDNLTYLLSSVSRTGPRLYI